MATQVMVDGGTCLPKGRLEPARGLECRTESFVLYAVGQGWLVGASLHANMLIDGDSWV